MDLQVSALQAKLGGLVKQFEDARDEKQRIEDQARKTQDKLNLAEVFPFCGRPEGEHVFSG